MISVDEKELRALVARIAGGKCECNMRTSLVGDGCEVCNSDRAVDILIENSEEQENE